MIIISIPAIDAKSEIQAPIPIIKLLFLHLLKLGYVYLEQLIIGYRKKRDEF